MEENENRYSYCGIGEVPYKTFLNKKLMQMIISEKGLFPIHAVIMPTNRCNLKCSFCNCSNRDSQEELSFDAICSILDQLQSLGNDTITLSGGGEPTLYPRFKELVYEIRKRNMKIGLVTNGVNITELEILENASFEWIRISCGDGRSLKQMKLILESACRIRRSNIAKKIGISYIVTENFDSILFYTVKEMVDELDEISYMKLLGDCFVDGLVPAVKQSDKKLIIARPTSKEVKNTQCYLPLIKPIFAPSGYVFPCCDVQYQEDARKYDKKKSYCYYTEYKENVINQRKSVVLDGACTKCFHYYSNEYLSLTSAPLCDENWL